MDKQATLRWHGVIAAMDTPLTEDGSDLNLGALPALLRFLKEAGLAGVFVGGSTGLGPLLSLEQREAVTEATVAAADGLTVLVHVGAERTADAVRLAQHAAQAGASGVAISVPPYYQHTPRAVRGHFQAVADAVRPLPTFLYRLGRDRWTLDDFRALQEQCPNLIGLKDSAGDLHFTQSAVAAGAVVFQGDERLALASMTAGAAGLVSGMATMLPELIVTLVRLASDPHRLEEARRYQAFVTQVRDLVVQPNAYACFKAILRHRGYSVGRVPGPFEELEPAQERALLERLQALGVL